MLIVSDGSTYEMPKKWTVILGRRHGERELVNETEVRALLGEMFGESRLVEYSGSLPIMKGTWPVHHGMCSAWLVARVK